MIFSNYWFYQYQKQERHPIRLWQHVSMPIKMRGLEERVDPNRFRWYPGADSEKETLPQTTTI